ncbi:MAG TPA: hypothetical protein VEX41_04930, partial [Candidatus Eisenbacteria bacterium]|nr:hypothetical protein [Candidatus Eisenbacteria bacterium]
MSLLRPAEKADQRGNTQGGGKTPPIVRGTPRVVVATPANAARDSGREQSLRQIRERVQDQVVRGFDTLLDISDPADVRSKVTGIVEQTLVQGSFSVTRDERLRLIEEVVDEIAGFGPIEPLLAD